MLPYFKFHHIGVAVHNINNTAAYYIVAGYEKTEIVTDIIQNIKICFLSKAGMPLIELLEPVNDKSPVCTTLSKVGVSPYHICYSVQDIEMAILDLKKIKFIPLSQPVGAVALGRNRICFLYNKEVGLIELLEEDSL